MLYILFILVLLFISCKRSSAVEENSDNDSLVYYLRKIDDPAFTGSTKKLLKKAVQHVATGTDSIHRKNVFTLSKKLYSERLEPELTTTITKLISISNTNRDSLMLAKAYNLLGNHYINLGKNDSAYIYLRRSEKLFLKMHDSVSLGKNYIDKAFAQLYENDFFGCEVSAIQGLAYIKSHNIKQSEYDAYNLIGISSNELKNFENAILYHSKALEIALSNNLTPEFHLAANSRNNLGVVYQNLDQHPAAIKYFEDALKDKNLLADYPSLYAMITDNLAYSHFKMNRYNNLPELFFEALRIRETNGFTSGIIANKLHISEYYAAIKDTINAQTFARQSLELAKKTKISGDLLGSLKQLAKVEHKNASKYSSEYIRISDSLQEAERNSKDKFARIVYETEEISIEKDKLAEQNRILFYFFITILSIGVLLFVIRSQRAKNRELLLKQAQQKANEDIYNLMISQQSKIEEGRIKEKKRIAQELHDGILGRLFGARLNLDSLNKSTNEESVKRRDNYLGELRKIEQDLREISHDLSREQYRLINNFVAILNNLIEEQKKSFASCDVELIIDNQIDWENVSNSKKINLYRIVQEGLQNINKYAQASKVSVYIKIAGDNLIAQISDNGVGFSVNTKKKGIGLQNMISRTHEVDGLFDIKSKKGKGTFIQITFPAYSLS